MWSVGLRDILMGDAEARRPVVLLAVDDESENNELVVRTFRRRGDYEVVTCLSGRAALDVVKSKDVALLLVDYSMDEMDGVTFIEQAKRVNPNLIVVMVTAYPELKEVAEAKTRGLVGHIIVKPWLPEDLFATIERLIGLGTMRDAVRRLRDLTA